MKAKSFLKLIVVICFMSLVCLPLHSIFAQWSKYFVDKTLRINYNHSGHVGVDYFTINSMKELPFYSGSHRALIDNTNNGAYLVSMFEKKTNKMIFSKGVSSLYNEWLSMPEAKTTCGNYEEVVLMPMPKEDVDVQIVFFVRDSINHWKESARLDLDKNIIEPSNAIEPNIITLNKTLRTMDKRVDLTFIPVGYTKSERIKMMKDLEKMNEYMFSESPYKEHKSDINIVAVERYSERSGLSGLKGRESDESDLGVRYGTFGSDRYIMTKDLWDLYDVIDAVPTDAIIIVCNSDIYGGGGIYNYYATCYMGNRSKEVIVHEFSHSFCGLGDEYADNDSPAGTTDVKLEPYEKNVTTLVDFSNKWGSMMDASTPIPTPSTKQYENKIGVYEGAAYMSKGFYRPYQHCMMRDLTPFCPVCTKAINDIIGLYCE